MQTINTFSKGMNLDADKSLMNKEQYLYSENMRLYTESGNTSGALENITGNTALTDSLGLDSSYKVCGYGTIRNELYIFYTTNTSTTPSGGVSIIVKCILNTNGTDFTSSSIIYTDSPFTNKLNFSSANKMKVVGRYESDTIKKLYWVDGYNVVRFANVGITLTSLDPNKFDIINNFTFTIPTFIEFGSGSLYAGKIQYAYQMYDKHGSETLFSPATDLISVSATSGMTGSNKKFKGTDKGTNAGKGIRLSITPPTGFDMIRVVSIMYTTLDATPTISIIAEESIADSTTSTLMYFYDAGTSSLGVYTYDEFAIVGKNIFVASEIETKDNYLFTANITQTDWDIDYDARAYRFLSATHPVSAYQRTAVLKNTADTSTTGDVWINGAYPTSPPSGYIAWADVPSKHNCINYHNVISAPYTDYTLFRYKADGTTLGGEGLNISYIFEVGSVIISATGTDYSNDYSNESDYSNASVEISNMGYQRSEIYRFGIVFYNAKGQASTVKWIGDIRFPGMNEYNNEVGYTIASKAGNYIYGYPLNIFFTINTATAYSQGAKSYRIVRCNRTSSDRTILAQGMVSACTYDQGHELYVKTFQPTYASLTTVRVGSSKTYTQGTTKTIIDFISPEINFNKNLIYKSGDRLECVGYYTDLYNHNAGYSSDIYKYMSTIKKYHSIHPVQPVPYSEGTTIIKSTIVPYSIITIPSTANDLYTSYSIDIGDSTYKFANMSNIQQSILDGLRLSPGGTSLVCVISSVLANVTALGDNLPLICNYRRDIINSQYGGPTYQARQSSTYISCGNLVTCTEGLTYSHVFGGDTYIAMYDYLRNLVTVDTSNSYYPYQMILYFPIETSINLRYRQDDCYSKTDTPSNYGKLLLSEYAGSYVSAIDSSISYNQATNLYIYNSVYSQQNTTVTYAPKSDLIDSDITRYDSRIRVSNKKINSETSDSWTEFLSDNYLDVDSTYGGITTLKNYRNLLYFWQPKAFGVASVNARSLIQDSTNTSLVLGTGGVLDRFDYVSTVSGCSYRFSVVDGLNGLYWVDLYNKGIYKYGGQEEALSRMKGINSLMKDTTPSLLSESISCYDKKNNEVLFKTYYNSSNGFISYSELFDSFNGIYTFDTEWLMQPNNTNFISVKASDQKLYMHNIGNKATFFGTIHNSKLKFIVNETYPETKTFDMFEYHSISKTSGGINNLTDTFNTIRCYNDYQNSDYVTITMNSNLIRKERGFTLAVPRNVVDTATYLNPDIFNASNLDDTTRTFRERMRDKYLIVDLTYTNANTYNFSIPYITTNYRISKR
jgi:hypothetical protein